jgi:hypothetical protein
MLHTEWVPNLYFALSRFSTTTVNQFSRSLDLAALIYRAPGMAGEI